MVALVARIVRRISRSTLVGGIAGLLLIADGVSFVAARTALLDGFLTFFVVAAFGALIVDRDQVRERMHVALLDGRIAETPWGPRLGVRWWRFGAGVLLGLACATKWSGLYFIVFFGAMSLAFDVAARRQYRVPRPWLGAAAARPGADRVRDGADPVRGVPGVVRAVVRLRDGGRPLRGGPARSASGGWFSRRTRSARCGTTPTRSIKFHSGLTNAAGNHHPWESKPWTWPMSLRPVLYAIDQQNVPGCGAQSCVKAVMLVGTPAMWWIAVPVLVWALWRAVRHAATGGTPSVLVGYCAGLLPWFADIDRQMYFFYAAPMAPFLVMAIALILRRHPVSARAERRTTNARAARRQLLRRAGDHELRVAVSRC